MRTSAGAACKEGRITGGPQTASAAVRSTGKARAGCVDFESCPEAEKSTGITNALRIQADGMRTSAGAVCKEGRITGGPQTASAAVRSTGRARETGRAEARPEQYSPYIQFSFLPQAVIFAITRLCRLPPASSTTESRSRCPLMRSPHGRCCRRRHRCPRGRWIRPNSRRTPGLPQPGSRC